MRWTQKVTNEELYRKIQLAETLLQKVIQRKLRLFGHICRMNDNDDDVDDDDDDPINPL